MLSRDEYDRQRQRLKKAILDLRRGGSLLHAIARAYYIVYLTASYAAHKFGVTAPYFRKLQGSRSNQFTHTSIAAVIHVLYTGNRSGGISPGSAPGIVGLLSHGEASRYAERLQRDRLDADYGPTQALEPYDELQADERLEWANMIVEDLRRIL